MVRKKTSHPANLGAEERNEASWGINDRPSCSNNGINVEPRQPTPEVITLNESASSDSGNSVTVHLLEEHDDDDGDLNSFLLHATGVAAYQSFPLPSPPEILGIDSDSSGNSYNDDDVEPLLEVIAIGDDNGSTDDASSDVMFVPTKEEIESKTEFLACLCQYCVIIIPKANMREGMLKFLLADIYIKLRPSDYFAKVPKDKLPVAGNFWYYCSTDLSDTMVYFESDEKLSATVNASKPGKKRKNAKHPCKRDIWYFHGDIQGFQGRADVVRAMMEVVRQSKSYHLVLEGYSGEDRLVHCQLWATDGMLSNAMSFSLMEAMTKLHTHKQVLLDYLFHKQCLTGEDNVGGCRPIQQATAPSLRELYGSIQHHHRTMDASYANENGGVDVQHPALIPTLRQYQRRAVNWMLYRESYGFHSTNAKSIALATHFIDELYEEVRVKSGNVLYLNRETGIVVAERPPPRGAIGQGLE